MIDFRNPCFDAPAPKRRRKRKRRVYPAPARSSRLYVYIDPSMVHMFRFLLEARDNLGLMTVVDRWRAALMLRFSPHQEREVREALEQMRESVPFVLVDMPLAGTGAGTRVPDPSRRRHDRSDVHAKTFCGGHAAKD